MKDRKAKGESGLWVDLPFDVDTKIALIAKIRRKPKKTLVSEWLSERVESIIGELEGFDELMKAVGHDEEVKMAEVEEVGAVIDK